MRLAGRARALAVGVTGVGVVLAYFDEWGAGFALITLGAAIALLVTEHTFPASLPDRSATGLMHALAVLAQDLNLQGRGILVPGATPAEPSRLFIPARDADALDVPAASKERVLHKDAGHARGVMLPPPGAGLEAEWRDAHGLPEGNGVEEATWHVRRAFHALGLGDTVAVSRSENVIRVTYRPTAFAGTLRAAREDLAPWHVQGGDPATSFAVILVARALAAPVIMLETGEDGARAFVDVEVAPQARTEGVRLRASA